MNAAERREKLLRILARRGKTSAKALAEELEVSERTVFRDVDILSTGKPIAAICGKYGGIYITDPKSICSFTMPEDELNLLRKLDKSFHRLPGDLFTPADHRLVQDMVACYSKTVSQKGDRYE